MLLSSFHFPYNLAGEIPAVGEPGAVLADGKGVSGDRMPAVMLCL